MKKRNDVEKSNAKADIIISGHEEAKNEAIGVAITIGIYGVIWLCILTFIFVLGAKTTITEMLPIWICMVIITICACILFSIITYGEEMSKWQVENKLSEEKFTKVTPKESYKYKDVISDLVNMQEVYFYAIRERNGNVRIALKHNGEEHFLPFEMVNAKDFISCYRIVE